MSRLILFNLVSLEGFFEGASPWSIDWHDTVVGEAFNQFAVEQLKSADRLLFGRVTFDGMAGYWPTAKGAIAELMNTLPKFVVSRGQANTTWANSTQLSGDVVESVRTLKSTGERSTLVFGSGELCRTLLDADLVDELRIAIAPVLLGKGTPLFGSSKPTRQLKLLEARTFSTNGVLLRYEPVRA